MDLFNPITAAALIAVSLLLLTLLFLRRRQRQSWMRRKAVPETLDTLVAWPPASVRVMTITERQAYELLKRALPGFMVLAQVPLSRFIRVPTRHSYRDWLLRVGLLSADLLLCDSGSRVLAAIDIRSPRETDLSRKRHERLARVLKAAGIRVYVWSEAQLPSLVEVRTVLGSDLAQRPSYEGQRNPLSSRPMPLMPVAEVEEILAKGDLAAWDSMEPVPSAFFEDEEHATAISERRH